MTAQGEALGGGLQWETLALKGRAKRSLSGLMIIISAHSPQGFALGYRSAARWACMQLNILH